MTSDMTFTFKRKKNSRQLYLEVLFTRAGLSPWFWTALFIPDLAVVCSLELHLHTFFFFFFKMEFHQNNPPPALFLLHCFFNIINSKRKQGEKRINAVKTQTDALCCSREDTVPKNAASQSEQTLSLQYFC